MSYILLPKYFKEIVIIVIIIILKVSVIKFRKVKFLAPSCTAPGGARDAKMRDVTFSSFGTQLISCIVVYHSITMPSSTLENNDMFGSQL